MMVEVGKILDEGSKEEKVQRIPQEGRDKSPESGNKSKHIQKDENYSEEA